MQRLNSCSSHASTRGDGHTATSDSGISVWPRTISRLLCRLSTRTVGLAFRFPRYSLGADPTENIVPLLMRMTWCLMLQCSGTLCLAPGRVATPLPAAFILSCGVTADGETTCLPSRYLATAFSWLS